MVDGLTINGQFTSGENIGDLGGLSIAYLAYKMSLDGKEAPVIDGWTGDQRFFLGWAQVWRSKSRDEESKRRLPVVSSITENGTELLYRPTESISGLVSRYTVHPEHKGGHFYLLQLY